MNRYIDADNLKAVIHANDWSNPVVPDVVGIIIDRSPTADVVEVVRCKDCKHWHNNAYDPIIDRKYGSCTCKYWEHPTEYFEMADNDYCCYGERREENEG